MAYRYDTLEEGLKLQVARDYFPPSSYDCTEIKGKIDFCVRPKIPHGKNNALSLDGRKLPEQSLLWAEAKKGEANPYESLVQLILTIGRARTFNEYLPPPFLGAFDARLMAFLPYTDVMEVFHKNDFNWNVAPSNHETREFKELYALVKDTLRAKSLVFYYDRDDAALRAFIKENLVSGRAGVHGIQIDKNNFLTVYTKWRVQVMPTIICDWEEFFGMDIIDADFYLADLLSRDDITIREKLAVLLESNKYRVSNSVIFEGHTKSLFAEGYFNDGMKAHKEFWRIYERPPLEEYWDYIVARRDLLVPQDIRERKGSFFTPQKWAELSQEYIARSLGEDWQDEYTVWDPCAGTGNLLAGLVNKYNVYASTLDRQDVDVMHDRIANGANLLDAHVFQFDFLNDDLASAKVPQSLREVLADTDKRKKLVIYMNPPYAEAGTSHGRKSKIGVSNMTSVHNNYAQALGAYAKRELFVQFLMRIYKEIPDCVIAQFSKLKGLQGPYFAQFRDTFRAKLFGGFMVPAYTFDNVNGKFPIGFFVWDTGIHEKFVSSMLDVYDDEGTFMFKKTVLSYDNEQFINDWLRPTWMNKEEAIGYIVCNSNDFQHHNEVAIISKEANMTSTFFKPITKRNLIMSCIYFSVRHCVEATWLNDRDQFLFPNDGWKADKVFQSNCLVYTLFSGQNRISARHGGKGGFDTPSANTEGTQPPIANINNWIPFTESEAGAGERFASHFMTDFMAGKAQGAAAGGGAGDAQGELGVDGGAGALIPSEPMAFTDAARAVLDAGRAVWRYYHECIKGGEGVNASLYDIREYFQGRDEKGRMNAASSDEKYAALMARLRGAMDALAGEIVPKVYEYGFLKK